MNCTLYDQVKSYQAGNQESALEILRSFAPLLKKHAYWLHTEDAYEELQCGLLEALKSMRLDRLSSVSQGVMVRYIQKTIRSQYIRMSKQRNKISSEIMLDDLNTRDTLQYIQRCISADDYSHLLFSDARQILTSTEYRVIWLLYHENYSAAQAARMLGKTRQAVNQVKQRALRKLKQSYMSPDR